MIFNGIYESKGRLGKGAFGEVFKVLNKNDNKFYALKAIIKDPKIKKDDFIKEHEEKIQIMKNIKSKYIVKLKENFYDEKYEGYCIIMDICDSDLRTLLDKYKKKGKGLPFEFIYKIFLQLNDALKELNEKNCIHRDLKPENILIKYTDNVNFDIKLTDFGLTTSDINSLIKSHSLAGTPNYRAPEIDEYHYNNKCDLWSLGVILYELYTNKNIFGSNIKEKEFNRKNGIIINKIDNKLINNLINKLIVVDIEKRIKWEEYFNDDFFKQQIIKIKINVDKDNEIIKIYNKNKDINEKNIKLFIDNKEIKNINNLKKEFI